MKGDKTQLRTPQIRPYPLQEKFKILFLGGYVYDGTNSISHNKHERLGYTVNMTGETVVLRLG